MNHCTAEQLIAFERGIADLWEAGELPYLIHLSGGNETQLIEIFQDIQPGDWVFSSHRNHYHYLLSGGSPRRLEGLIRSGNSMFVYERACPIEQRALLGHILNSQVNFISSSILAGTCAIAAGVALQIRKLNSNPVGMPHVWCFLGDGAEDEGHFYEAVMMVEGHGLPCTFVIEDNNRSVDSTVKERRGELRLLYPMMLNSVRRYFYTPTYPHAGSGCKHRIEFKKLC